MLQPCVRKTWVPKGKTPIHNSLARHDRLSVIGALRVSPKHRTTELHFTVQACDVKTPDLNPVEQVWAHTKHHELGNFIPHDLDHLQLQLSDKFETKRFRQGLHRNFFNHTGLPL
jgi:hypothetical protein